PSPSSSCRPTPRPGSTNGAGWPPRMSPASTATSPSTSCAAPPAAPDRRPAGRGRRPSVAVGCEEVTEKAVQEAPVVVPVVAAAATAVSVPTVPAFTGLAPVTAAVVPGTAGRLVVAVAAAPTVMTAG